MTNAFEELNGDFEKANDDFKKLSEIFEELMEKLREIVEDFSESIKEVFKTFYEIQISDKHSRFPLIKKLDNGYNYISVTKKKLPYMRRCY